MKETFAFSDIQSACLALDTGKINGKIVVTMYAAARNIMTKTDEQLRRLREIGINDLYVGIGNGLDDVLALKQDLILLLAGRSLRITRNDKSEEAEI